ncbi:DUF2695 domain-containing protein [Modestobacter roseus]|nr:DUF2695 domain-containing protein [Modestobacter roseus]
MDDPLRAAEAHVAALADELTRPRAGECLLCYTARMLEEGGCDGTLRWVRRWRDVRLPRATALERRLGGRGAYCDCEVFLNGWTVGDHLAQPGPDGEPEWPDTRPGCVGVSARSSQPCANWVPHRRGW